MKDEEPDRLVVLEDRDRLALGVGVGGGQRLGQATEEALLVGPRAKPEKPVAQLGAHRREADIHGAPRLAPHHCQPGAAGG